MIFDLKDILLNSGIDVGEDIGECTQKYFSDFDKNEYSINLTFAPNRPVFLAISAGATWNDTFQEAKTITGGSGLEVGQYAYSYRFVDSTGNRTQFSPATPLIPVYNNVSTQSAAYPGIKTYGAAPNTVTGYGIVCRIRIDNKQGYDYIEIKRVSYNGGVSLGFTPAGEIIGTIDIENKEVGIKTFLDYGATGEEIITDVEDTARFTSIERAKAIRYYNQRLVLMNIKYASRDITDDVEGSLIDSNEPIYPIVKNIGKLGYNKAQHAAYHRSFTRGEKYGFAIVFFDETGEKSFAVPLPNAESLQMPNRRENCNGKNRANSEGKIPYTANDTGWYGHTYETFDMENARRKSDFCSFINYSGRGDKKSKGICTQPCDCPGVDENKCTLCYGSWNCPDHGKFVCGDEAYDVFSPIGDSDNDTSEHEYQPTQMAFPENGKVRYNYQPQGFAPEHIALGAAFEGIDPDELPTWVQSFMIVRTKPAGRVVTQGLGHYSLCSGTQGGFLNIANSDRCSKKSNEFWFHSTDIDHGIVSTDKVKDIQNNPNKYKVQLVAPLGFFNEMYSNKTDANRDESIDFVTYARIQRELGQCNVGDWNVALAGYIQFGKWRGSTFPGWANSGNIQGSTPFTGYNGNGVFDFHPNGFSQISGNSSNCQYAGDRAYKNYWRIRTVADIYQHEYVGGIGFGDDKHFRDPDVKNWHEPYYMVNIIDETAEVPIQDVNEYFETSAYVKLRSKIGVADGDVDQQYILVDERWEDCIPSNDINDPSANQYNSHLIIKTGSVKRYGLHIGYKSQVDIDAIKLAIDSIGYYDDGLRKNEFLYFHTNPPYDDGWEQSEEQYVIQFDSDYAPPEDSEVWVFYDPKRVIKVFGGEGFVGEQTWCPIDMKVTNKGDHSGDTGDGTAFWFNNGFPYYRWDINHRIIQINKAHGSMATTNKIQDSNCFTMDWCRQMVNMYNTESRVNTNSYYENATGSSYNLAKYFPATHYIVRPVKWKKGDEREKNFIDEDGLIRTEYNDDYPQEWSIWPYGGFRYGERYNIDYSHTQNQQVYFNKPPVGYIEQTEFCTRIVYSTERPINIQDVPGLKTFLANAYFDISDDTGEIKRAFDCLSAKGNNLYALTHQGICLLFTDKSVLSDKNVNEVALIGTEAEVFILGQYWLSKVIGMDVEMWRTAAEFNNMLFWTNLQSSYSLIQDQIRDIGRLNYHSKLYKGYLSDLTGGYVDEVSGCYDTLHNEYWFTLISSPTSSKSLNFSFAFNLATDHWNGTYSYSYKHYVSYDNKTFGIQNQLASQDERAEVFELNKGGKIGFLNIFAWALQAFAPKQIFSKEFIRIRVASSKAPTKIEFYDNMEQHDTGPPQAILDPGTSVFYLKDYGAFEQYVPRRILLADPNRKRMQGRLLLAKVHHDTDEEFKLIDTAVQYKLLK